MTAEGAAILTDGEKAFSLNIEDASVARAMLARGDDPFDVALWFGVTENIIEQLATLSASHHLDIKDPGMLPPPGPYPGIRVIRLALNALEMALNKLNVALTAAGLLAKTFRIPKIAGTIKCVPGQPGKTEKKSP